MGSAQAVGCSTDQEIACGVHEEACYNSMVQCRRGGQSCCGSEIGPSPVETQPGAGKALKSLQLQHAARDGQVNEIRSLLEARAYIESRRPFALTATENAMTKEPMDGLTPLMYAAQAGHAEACELLLKHGALVNAEDEDGLRPLHFAAQCASEETCRLLLRHGAEPGARDLEGNSALDYLPADELSMTSDKAKWHRILKHTHASWQSGKVVPEALLEGGAQDLLDLFLPEATPESETPANCTGSFFLTELSLKSQFNFSDVSTEEGTLSETAATPSEVAIMTGEISGGFVSFSGDCDLTRKDGMLSETAATPSEVATTTDESCGGPDGNFDLHVI